MKSASRVTFAFGLMETETNWIIEFMLALRDMGADTSEAEIDDP
jgi:hypothetical protein